MKAVYTRDGFMATAWLSQRQRVMIDPDDQDMLRFVVTSVRIHSWVNASLGRVRLRAISALMLGPFELESAPPQPFRDENMVFPAGDRSFWQSIHIIGDEENDAIDDPDRKFLRAGLWHSALLAGGTLVGHGDRLYIVPHDDLGSLAVDIKANGEDAFEKYDSFFDPTLQFTDANGLIKEPGEAEGLTCFPDAEASPRGGFISESIGIETQGGVFAPVLEKGDGYSVLQNRDILYDKR